jgi:hypothetical protein
VQWRQHPMSLLSKEEKKEILGEVKLREKKIEEDEEIIKHQNRDSTQKAIADKKKSFYETLNMLDQVFGK